MARISTYDLDTNVTKRDKVIGTDSTGLVTKNFELLDIAKVANKEITIAGQLVYQFKENTNNGALTNLTDGALYSSVTRIRLSGVDFPGHNVQDFLQEYNGKRIIIVDIDDKNKYGIFDVTAISEDEDNLGHYFLDLDFQSGNGTLTLDNNFLVAIYVKESADAFYTHAQGQASSTWEIEHNLNKFPSVTVVLSTGQKGYADVSYTDENNLTITFAGDETGKAYLN